MRVIVTGGTGLVGLGLVRLLAEAGHQATVLTRNAQQATRSLPEGVRAVDWDNTLDWYAEMECADAVVNLAGESIAGGRWTPARKHKIRDSRTMTTHRLVAAMGRSPRRPKVLVSASAVGYYGPHGAEHVTESEPPGADFLAHVCRDWELEATGAVELGVRVVLLRLGVVLGDDGGALARMLLPFRLFVGGPLGNGRQPFPWIHRDDVIGLIEFALTNSAVQGPINATAPDLHTNLSFSQALGRVLGRPCWAPVPGPVLRLLLGEMAGPLLLQGQQVVPALAQRLGYQFKYPVLGTALKSIVRR